MKCQILGLDEVPPLPRDAVVTDQYADFKVYDVGPLRWRFKGEKLRTFIEYDEDMLALLRTEKRTTRAPWKKLYDASQQPNRLEERCRATALTDAASLFLLT